jgi:hypothetical protein
VEARTYQTFWRQNEITFDVFREAREIGRSGEANPKIWAEARRRVAARHGVDERTVRNALKRPAPGPHG